MKLLYIHNKDIRSQMANAVQVKAMCRAFSDLDLEVILSVPDYESGTDTVQKNDEINYKLHTRKTLFSNIKLDKYFSGISIQKTINRFKPDLLYLRHPIVLRQCLKSRVPAILELHNNSFYGRFHFVDNYYSNLIVDQSKNGIINKVVCISQALSDYWIKNGVPAKKVLTAHDGVDASLFDIKSNILKLRSELNLPNEKKIITYAGRLYENRSIGSVIQLAKEFPEDIFLVIGGPEIQKIKYEDKASKEKLSNIKFIGQVPHKLIPKYLHASDILLALWSSEVPTINYCSPLKIFEYMASGKIIVAHGFPTIKEVLTHNKNALLVKPDSLTDLIDKTREALSMQSPNKIGELARNIVLNEYTWQKRSAFILADYI